MHRQGLLSMRRENKRIRCTLFLTLHTLWNIWLNLVIKHKVQYYNIKYLYVFFLQVYFYVWIRFKMQFKLNFQSSVTHDPSVIISMFWFSYYINAKDKLVVFSWFFDDSKEHDLSEIDFGSMYTSLNLTFDQFNTSLLIKNMNLIFFYLADPKLLNVRALFKVKVLLSKYNKLLIHKYHSDF